MRPALGTPWRRKKALSSPFDTGLLDLSTGREVYARSSDLPGKNDLLALHGPALSMRSFHLKGKGGLPLLDLGDVRCGESIATKLEERIYKITKLHATEADFTNYKITRNEQE